MGNIFKAYDIRGKYKEEFDEKDAYKIGFFIPEILNTQNILVGRDGRTSSPALFKALCDGITDAGANVYELGIVTTPMVYYFTDKYNFDCSVQITASHNPENYNGFKISKRGARPVGYDTGLSRLEHSVKEHEVLIKEKKGKIIDFSKKDEYAEFMKSKCEDISGFKIVMDCSNGAVCKIVSDIFGNDVIYINNELDGTFPNHNPNPLEEENTSQLKQKVLETNADIGVIFDGDGDRVAFIDEKGRFISPDLITAVLAQACIENPGDMVLYDIRSSWSVEKYVKKLGGKSFMWKVGHVYAKEKMREIDAVVGGELAGHYYFKEFMCCDSGILATIKVLQQLKIAKKDNKAISDIIEDISKYYYSGEINFKIKNKEEAIDKLLIWSDMVDMPKQLYTFDGYRIEYENWWYNVRISNTENYLRIVVEADAKEVMQKRVKQIKEILDDYTE